MADTTLSTQGSKFISLTPLYPGDLINNTACYWPTPDFSKKEWKMLQMNAESFAHAGSVLNSSRKKRMVFCSMSGGYFGYEKAEQNPGKVLAASKRFITGDDSEFLTIQKLAGALGGDIMGSDIFARNGAINEAAVEWMSKNTMRDTVNVGPNDREGHLRALHSIHSIMQGLGYEDATFEMGVWGPEVLLEHDGGVYYRDHAWSRNGANEKAVGLAIQYGSQMPLEARQGRGFDIVDIMNRPVSVVDQAWEDARHLVDVVERGFRSETAAALMISRIMHDQMWHNNSPNLDKDNAHETVSAHYSDPAEMERMEQLKAMIVPYMAEKCNWPTLHRILDNDPDLKRTWEEDIAPHAAKLGNVAQLEIDILSYLPRGGFEGGKLNEKIEQRKDPAQRRIAMGIAQTTPRPLASHHYPFDPKFDSKIFNDRNFARLGGISKPDYTPDNDHLTFDQTASIMLVNAAEKDRRPTEGSKTFLYLDDPAGGLVGAELQEQHGVSDTRGLKTMYDPLAKDSVAFTEGLAKDHAKQMAASVKALTSAQQFEEFRAQNDLGQIITLSDLKKIGQEYKKPRTLPNGDAAYFRDGHASDGGDTMSSAAIQTVARRITALSADGILLNPGKTTATEARIIGEAVNVAMGQIERPYAGGEFKMDFFMNYDYREAPADQGEPVQMDLGDLILHIGSQVKANLESKNPDNMNDLNVTLMRLLEYYEMTVDPGRRNSILVRDDKTGADVEKHIIDHTQVNPEFTMSLLEHEPGSVYLEDLDVHMVGENPMLDAFLSNPAFQDFSTPEKQKTVTGADVHMDDPAAKVREVQMMWAWMRAMPVYTQTSKDAAATPMPVTGMLTTKGMVHADDYDLADAHEDYRSGRDAMRNLNERQRKNIYGSGQIYVDSPQITVN